MKERARRLAFSTIEDYLLYKNVHNDVERLMEWLAIERDAQGKVFTPYAEIVVDVHLPQQRAA